jgi:hypothetical protein
MIAHPGEGEEFAEAGEQTAATLVLVFADTGDWHIRRERIEYGQY